MIFSKNIRCSSNKIKRASDACSPYNQTNRFSSDAISYSVFTSVVVVLVTLLLLAELLEATIATMINSNATPPTTQTVGLFIQAGASAGVDVVVCVSVVFVWEASVASWANAYTPDIRQRNNRKHFEAALIIVFFIKLVCVS